VTKDLPVINRSHAVVGKVIPNGLTKTTAEVLLLTDEQCKVAARIGRSVSMRGIVAGYRGLGNLTPEIRLNFLDPDILLPAGAMLYTDEGEGQVFPSNLLIGRVLRQLKGDYYDSAVIEPQVDFAKLDSVFVIRTTDDEEEADAVGPTVEETASITP
jgi:cell shape-determining protein MreC